MGDDLPNLRRIDAGAGRPPTILQVTPELNSGGVERGTLEIGQAIVAAGGRALVASAGGRMSSRFRNAGVEVIEAPMASKNPLTMARNARTLARLAEREQVDVIHARSRAAAWSAFAAARRTGAPFVTTYHGAYSETLPFKRAYNAVMASGDVVIAISNYIAEMIRARHKTPEARIVVIPRGADTAIFTDDAVSAARVVALAEKWGVADDARPVLMLPGRLTRWKGQTVFLEALEILRERLGPNAFHALIVGGEAGAGPKSPVGKTAGGSATGAEIGRFERELHRAVMVKNLADCVTLTGHCDDMPAAYKLASFAISASTEPEAFGRVAVEAQAMGVPILAAAHGGAMETVLDEETGWLFAPGDAEALADAMSHVLSIEPEARLRVGRAGVAHARSRYSVAQMQAATLAVYERLMGRAF